MREVLEVSKVDPGALKSISGFHSDTVREVKEAIAKNKVVVVGMSQNPVVSKARKILDNAGVKYAYCEYGSYFSSWKPRLAIKLWSGWPTFPQIFVDGRLIGGCADLVEWMKTNSLK
jgi:glutaredoxin-related protein